MIELITFPKGHLKLVKYGATAQAKGRCGATPLWNAIQLTSKKEKYKVVLFIFPFTRCIKSFTHIRSWEFA